MPGARTGYVVDVQSRLLSEIATRVVIPLLPKDVAPKIAAETLNPVFSIDGSEYVLMTQNLATVRLKQLRTPTGTMVSVRDQIVRAIDALLSGI